MTNKKCLIMIILMVLAAGWSFAQVDSETGSQAEAVEEKPQNNKPMNMITVDFGPTVVGLSYQLVGSLMSLGLVDFPGFGIGAQYERHITEQFSLAGRFAYMGFGIGVDIGADDVNADFALNLYSFSAEAHARYYLVDNILFIDGMMGWANFSIAASATAESKEHDVKEKASFRVTRNYLKLGALVGARGIAKFKTGGKAGMVFETAVGYYHGGIGFGDTIGTRLTRGLDEDMTVIDGIFKLFESWIFIGGLRQTLSVGIAF